MPSGSEYISGVCNIGLPEIRMRKKVGWVGLAFTIILWLAFIMFDVPVAWRLLLFIPATITAIGFLQARLRFCVAFGLMGVFNLGPKRGHIDHIGQPDHRRKDRQKALRIILYAVFTGIVLTAAAFFL